MPEEKNIVHKETTTEEKMKELFDLMDEKAAVGELNEIEDEPKKAEEEAPVQEKNPEEEDGPMSASERAGYEYAMMMRQYEAMLEEYMRLEAEEKAAKKKAEEEAEEEAKAKETE